MKTFAPIFIPLASLSHSSGLAGLAPAEKPLQNRVSILPAPPPIPDFFKIPRSKRTGNPEMPGRFPEGHAPDELRDLIEMIFDGGKGHTKKQTGSLGNERPGAF